MYQQLYRCQSLPLELKRLSSEYDTVYCVTNIANDACSIKSSLMQHKLALIIIIFFKSKLFKWQSGIEKKNKTNQTNKQHSDCESQHLICQHRVKIHSHKHNP